MDMGVYSLYPALYFWGRPESFTATARMMERGADGQGGITFTYPDKVVHMRYSKVGSGMAGSDIHGANGTIVMNSIGHLGDMVLVDNRGERKLLAEEGRKIEIMASPVLMKGSRESGAGRWTVIEVPTLSFFEYCELLKIEVPVLSDKLKITDMLTMTQQEKASIIMSLSDLSRHFIRYLQVGGFPELALSDNDLLAAQIMREDVVDKVLKRDLSSLYNVRNSTELERIFLYLCNVSSEIVSIEAITRELNGVSRPTVENYIKYLESANLIYQSWPIDMVGKKVLKASPKIYISDAAIRNSVLMDDGILSNMTEMGKVVETAVFKHVSSFFYQKATSVGYARVGKKGKEIDIVIETPASKNILIEVKYRNGAPVPNDSAIVELCSEAQFGIIITKNIDDFGVYDTPSGKQLLRIPAFAFLYLLGHLQKNGTDKL